MQLRKRSSPSSPPAISAPLALLLLPWLASPAPAAEIQVFAAASLARAFTAAQAELRPRLTLHLSFAGSQQLALQLAEGARADVFASADERCMRQVEEKGLLVARPRVFARNRLVVITPADDPGDVADLASLARPGVKVVLAAKPVPAGEYARQALEALGRRPDLGPEYAARVLANVVSEEENVGAVLAKVRLGEADAGIVYVSDVTADVRGDVRTIEIPPEANVEAQYWVGILKGGPNEAAAVPFVTWLLTPPGQRVLAAHGLLPARE